MKEIHIFRLLMIGLFCTCICTCLLAIVTQEEVCISLPFSQTVLLDQEEVYRKGISNEPAFKRRTCILTLVDSSCTIKDTLCGKCWYLLYFDTTILADGIELQRTKDSLCSIYNLNRDVDSYRSGELLRAPHEIIVADSLIKSALHTKHIWMDKLTPYYAPYHSLIVNFTIIPSKNGGVITLNRDEAWSSSIPEEIFHALQKDNNGKYDDTQLNLEFEAKVFVIMSGLPTGSYYGMDEFYCKSLLNIDIREFTQPQSITEYIKQANDYSTINKNNAIGNKNYWTSTTISPYNLISIIGKLK